MEIIFSEVTLKSPKEETKPDQEKILEKTNMNTPIPQDDFVENTILAESENDSSKPGEKEKRQYYLRYARTILDTFLILYPEYSTLVLKQQVKELTENKLTRLDLEDKIARDFYLYLKERYLEGPERDFNKYAGPGIQIPIGDLIKDLF